MAAVAQRVPRGSDDIRKRRRDFMTRARDALEAADLPLAHRAVGGIREHPVERLRGVERANRAVVPLPYADLLLKLIHPDVARGDVRHDGRELHSIDAAHRIRDEQRNHARARAELEHARARRKRRKMSEQHSIQGKAELLRILDDVPPAPHQIVQPLVFLQAGRPHSFFSSLSCAACGWRSRGRRRRLRCSPSPRSPRGWFSRDFALRP